MLQRLNKESEFEEVRLTTAGKASSFQSSRKKLLDTLLERLDVRFDDLDSGLLQATATADMQSWLHKDYVDGEMSYQYVLHVNLIKIPRRTHKNAHRFTMKSCTYVCLH